MKLVVDMNLSPDWVAVLQRHGWETVHWSTVGNPRATDAEILRWANATGHVVFTHDLGFGGLLAATDAGGPSVMDVTPAHLETVLVAALRSHQSAIEEGALVTVDKARSRVRILAIKRSERV